MKSDHEKKIITCNAMQLLWEQNPNYSLYRICKIMFEKAYSKRMKLGFNCKSFDSFYRSVIKFNNNSTSPLLINPKYIKELEATK